MTETTRKTQLTIVTGLMLLSFVFHQKMLLYASALLGVVFLLSDRAGTLLVDWWMKVGHAMGWLNSRILLTLVYFLILLPISVLFKIMNRNPLQLKRGSETTFFIDRKHTYGPEDLRDMW